MDPLRLNTTDECHNCRKAKARWALYVDVNYAVPENPRFGTSVRHEFRMCPICDCFTPEDLELDDRRTIKIPGSGPTVDIVYRGAQNYRQALGPDRPFRTAGSKTMRRRYNPDGSEYTGD